jgi:hypothetical protein
MNLEPPAAPEVPRTSDAPTGSRQADEVEGDIDGEDPSLGDDFHEMV